MPDDMLDPTQGAAPQQPPNMAQGANTAPSLAPQQRGGPRPILMDLIQGLVKPRMQAPGPGQQATPVSRAQTFENFLGNFVYALGQGFANEGHGPGAAARGAGAAVSAPLQLGMQQQQFQSEQAQRQAQAQMTQQQAAQMPAELQAKLTAMTQQPRFDPDTRQYVGNMTDKQFEQYVRGAGAAKVKATAEKNVETMKEQSPLAQAQAAHLQAQDELSKAHADVLSNPNNPTFRQKEREIQAKLALARQNVALRSQSNNLRAGDMATKLYQPAMDADVRLATMRDNLQEGLKGDQQAMLSLLANHIGMTLGLQKGARITKDILHEAQNSAPWLQKVQAKFDDDGYLSGVTLSPNQMQQMVGLGEKLRPMAWQKARNQARAIGVNMEPDPLSELGRVPEAPPVRGGTSSGPTSGSVRFRANGRVYNIPTNRQREFLSEFPAATQIK